MDLKDKSVLVTGGAGFIGSHLVDRLTEESPANLIVVDNLFLGNKKNLSPAMRNFPSLRLYEQDASDFKAMEKIIGKEAIDVVFNLAIIPLPTSLERPRWTVDVNVALTTVLCELLRQGRFKSLIHFSSSEIYGSAQYVPIDEKHPIHPCTPYAASKAAADLVVLSYQNTFGLDATTVRPFNNFGPRQNDAKYAGIIPIVINKALAGEPITIFDDGEQTRDFIFVKETADATVRIFKEPATRGQTINVASGCEVSINALVRELLSVLNVDVPIIHKEARPGDVRRHCGGIELAKKLIGFQPKTALRAGLIETVEWYKHGK